VADAWPGLALAAGIVALRVQIYRSISAVTLKFNNGSIPNKLFFLKVLLDSEQNDMVSPKLTYMDDIAPVLRSF
jgi:hypothetical protein